MQSNTFYFNFTLNEYRILKRTSAVFDLIVYEEWSECNIFSCICFAFKKPEFGKQIWACTYEERENG